jgi:DegV family protein with EDD domain
VKSVPIEKEKNMLKIVMDTAGDMPPEWQEKYQIDLIPINIIHDGKNYRQGLDLNYDDFYQMVETSNAIPSTSQPTPYQFTEFYRKIAKPGDTVLSVHVTEKLSGTMASAMQAAAELQNEIKIVPFDSASGTICMGMMVREARELDRRGSPLEAILTRLEEMRRRMELVFTVDTLKFASMSGRVKHLQAALASMLNVKPIIELKNGLIEMGEKVRSRSKSIDKLLEKMKQKFGDRRITIGVLHAHDPQSGMDLLNRVVRELNCAEAIFGEISISLAAHFGPGTLGLAAYPMEE